MNTRKHIFSFPLSLLLAVVFCFSSSPLWAETITSKAQLPTFYAGLDNQSGTDLVTALKDVCNVSTFSADSYATVWTNFATTDVYPSDSTGKAGKLWDMYSNVLWTVGEKKCGNYSGVGTCYNREHSMPKSWFGVSGSTPPAGPGTDMHHMYPTDGQVNNQRSNFPFGECSGGTRLTTGDYYGTGKLGTSTLTGFTSVGTVWEPDDQYKGDFARTYMYMLMKWCANGTSFTQDGTYGKKTFNNTFTSDGNYGLTDYGVALLMKWHKQDPVSRKEIDRNNAVQSVQGNRNPFIDYPCLAEYLWGDKKDQTFKLDDVVGSFDDSFTQGVSDGCACGTDPIIKQPGSEVDCGATETNVSIVKTITIQGDNLTSGLSFDISGTNLSFFKLSASSMTQANATAGKTIDITYRPTSAGNHTATLTISGGGLSSSKTVTLTGSCCTPYNITLSRNGVTETLSVCGTYTLPTADDEADACDGWEFKGWLASGTSFTEGTTTAPTFVTSVSSAKTLHAVYGKSSGGGSTRFVYEKVKSAPSNWAGTYLIVCGAENLAFNGGLTTLDAVSNTISVTINNDTITSNATTNAAAFTIATSSTSYTIQSASGYYIGQTSDANGLNSNTSTKYTNTITYNEGDVDIVSSGGAYLRYNKTSGQTRFRYYKSSTYTSQQAIQLYKLTSVSSGGTMTYKKTPCTNYTITLSGGGTATNGSFEASASNATEGTTIYLEADPEECYQLSSWTVTKAGGGTVTPTDDHFTMPASNVTVSASFSALPNRTATFKNGTATFATVTDCQGTEISVGTPTACDGYTFEGWSTSTYAADNTSTPTFDFDGIIPSSNTTYNAVYKQVSGGISGAADEGTILWAENFAHFGTKTPSAAGTGSGTTIYGGASISYSQNSDNTKGYAEALAGGESPELLIYKGGSNTWTISGIKTGDAALMTLTFKSNKSTFEVTTNETTKLAVSGSGKAWEISVKSGQTAPTTFNLTIKNTNSSQNLRIDDVSLVITTANSSATTYHTTSPDCAVPTYDLTIAASPAGYGSVSTSSVTDIPSGSAVTTNGNQFTVNGTTVTATPTTATAQYTYAFSSWSNLPATVTADVTNVTANFTRTLRSYTVTFKDNFGTTLKTQTVNYGSAATAPSIPNIDCYTHGTWDKAYNNITGDLTVTVTYTIIPYTITAVPDNATHGSVTITP